MPGFLVDTNVISEVLRPSPHPGVCHWIERQPSSSLFVSVISIGELLKGIALLPAGARRTRLEVAVDSNAKAWFEDRVLAVTLAVVEVWGQMDAVRRAAGRPLNMADGLIAATAKVHDVTLATRNVRDFEGLSLPILSPWD